MLRVAKDAHPGRKRDRLISHVLFLEVYALELTGVVV